jgi:hypothetical protein
MIQIKDIATDNTNESEMEELSNEVLSKLYGGFRPRQRIPSSIGSPGSTVSTGSR